MLEIVEKQCGFYQQHLVQISSFENDNENAFVNYICYWKNIKEQYFQKRAIIPSTFKTVILPTKKKTKQMCTYSMVIP